VPKFVGAVIFEDSTRLYLIYDSATDTALRPLFATESAALNWQAQGMPKVREPDEAGATEEPVTVVMSLDMEKTGELGLSGRFASRASRKANWLTGSRSFYEMIYLNGATASRVF